MLSLCFSHTFEQFSSSLTNNNSISSFLFFGLLDHNVLYVARINHPALSSVGIWLQLNRSVHAKGLPPTQGGPQSSQLQLLLRSSPSSCGSGSNQGGSPDDGPSEAADATDALVGGPTGPMGPAGKAQGLRQEVCDYHSGGSSSSRRYGSNSSSSSGGGRSRPPVVAYSGLLRRDT